ncbi:hypothetical protein EUGRSUZ_J03038 [Eucalyptus grandis]|uniref:Uncharacterized protein n=3 Tax=Eucalyptus grandis TaxID=71139 RepID=A0A059AJC3_EUCGR|nr:hypothetical protein EUGRSUZ_J03038 [Eucalyptus grandis]KAK3411020.1 hypothetical protein EUGRSUZ_J03038 [Eucalyptus grandis]
MRPKPDPADLFDRCKASPIPKTFPGKNSGSGRTADPRWAGADVESREVRSPLSKICDESPPTQRRSGLSEFSVCSDPSAESASMWRRLVSSHLPSLSSAAAAAASTSGRSALSASAAGRSLVLPAASASVFVRRFGVAPAQNAVKKKVEDVMPIATGHEREEIEAELEGRNLLEINYPVGPFGTKEAPAVIKSYYDKRIVGCPGGEDEDEHDVVWFWLEKGKPHECPVCSQYFVLEVVGPGGPPDGHGDDEDHH